MAVGYGYVVRNSAHRKESRITATRSVNLIDDLETERIPNNG